VVFNHGRRRAWALKTGQTLAWFVSGFPAAGFWWPGAFNPGAKPGVGAADGSQPVDIVVAPQGSHARGAALLEASILHERGLGKISEDGRVGAVGDVKDEPSMVGPFDAVEMLAGARRAERESDAFVGRLPQGGTRSERVCPGLTDGGPSDRPVRWGNVAGPICNFKFGNGRGLGNDCNDSCNRL
jgi:hypothetical protein